MQTPGVAAVGGTGNGNEDTNGSFDLKIGAESMELLLDINSADSRDAIGLTEPVEL
jgi:hypothetical protein